LYCGTAEEVTQKLFFSGINRSQVKLKPNETGKDTSSGKISGISNGQPESFAVAGKTGRPGADDHRKV